MKTTKLGRGIAALAMLITASLALSGCLYSQIPKAAPRVEKTADVSDVAADLLPFYTQKLTWKRCDSTFDCTTVKVPLDYADPSGQSIELSVIRHRATGQQAPVGSLLTNPGGPGASGVALVRDSLSFAVGKPLQQAFDVIGFDPRGVGESNPVKCYDGTQMDAYLYDIPAAKHGTDEWQTEMDERAAGFAKACSDNSGDLLAHITTDNAARDMDVLRSVLGDDELNYLGYSYGTFLGATYAKLFPKKVGRLVLDGAIDPSVSGLDVGTTQGLGFENALRAYMTDCLAGSGCPFKGTVDQALSDVTALMHSVDQSPLAGDDGRQLGSDALQTAIISAMYSQDNWPYLTQALTEVLQGNPTTAFLLADFYNGRTGPGTYEDNSTEAFNAYNCMDYPENTDKSLEDAADALLKEKAPTFYDFWSGGDVCKTWAAKPTGVREKITADGAAPIVVVGTTNDPATPYAWSESLADQLSSGVLVTRQGEGHTGYNKGNRCVDGAVESYLTKGTVPENGLTC